MVATIAEFVTPYYKESRGHGIQSNIIEEIEFPKITCLKKVDKIAGVKNDILYCGSWATFHIIPKWKAALRNRALQIMLCEL